MINNVLKVCFVARQGAEDIYRNVLPPYDFYVRQPNNDKETVAWLTGTRWHGGVEASCHLREGVVIEIVDTYTHDKPVIYTEEVKKYRSDEYNNFPDDTYAIKVAPFSYEATKLEAKRIAELHCTHTHEEWVRWLTEIGKSYGITSHNDNWLYCSSLTVDSVFYKEISYLNKRCFLYEERKRHNIAKDCEWIEYLLLDKDGLVVEICGYVFDDKSSGYSECREKLESMFK